MMGAHQIKSIIESAFRTCLNCGYLFPNNSLFCFFCEKELIKRDRNDLVHMIRPAGKESFPLYTLWNWHPDMNRPLSLLLESLKKCQNRDTYFYYAQLFVQWRLQQKDTHFLNDEVLLVPAPSSRSDSQEKNHADWLAFTISELLLLKYKNLLKKKLITHSTHQKLLNKKERSQIVLSTITHDTPAVLAETPADNPAEDTADTLADSPAEATADTLADTPEKNDCILVLPKRIIFIDDIVTTGNTAYAAYQALNKPQFFEIWALAYRAKRPEFL